MYEFKSTLTSKGQLTLPKPIRKMMKLEEGVQVSFAYDEGKDEAVLKKVSKKTGYVSAFQLFNYYLKKHETILINGKSGSGKTSLAKRYIYELLDENYSIYKLLDKNDNICLVNFLQHDVSIVQESMYGSFIKSLYEKDIDNLLESTSIKFKETDYVFIDHAEEVNPVFLEKVISANTKSIFLSHNFNEELLDVEKGYLKVNVDRDFLDLELVQMEAGEVKVTPIILISI